MAIPRPASDTKLMEFAIIFGIAMFHLIMSTMYTQNNKTLTLVHIPIYNTYKQHYIKHKNLEKCPKLCILKET